MSPLAHACDDPPEFGDFALMPASGVREGFDAAGIDGRLPDGSAAPWPARGHDVAP